MDSRRHEVALGIDVGGTNVKIGIVDREGQILDFISCPTVRDDQIAVSISCIADPMMALVDKYRNSHSITGIGLSTPGILDTKKGIVHYAINLGWEELPLADLLEEIVNLPVWIVSDVSAGALGEYHFGSAQNNNKFLFICIGTGISASYLSDGSFFPTSNGTLLNVGHTSIEYDGQQCACGNKGCLEQFVSSSAIVSRVEREREQLTPLLNDFYDEFDRIGVLEIYESANKGHDYAQKVLNEAGETLGVAIVNMVNLFGPGLIVIGGGVSLAESFFLESARRVVAERLPLIYKKELIIASATHPKHAGILGAAVTAFRQFDQSKEQGRVNTS